MYISYVVLWCVSYPRPWSLLSPLVTTTDSEGLYCSLVLWLWKVVFLENEKKTIRLGWFSLEIIYNNNMLYKMLWMVWRITYRVQTDVDMCTINLHHTANILVQAFWKTIQTTFSYMLLSLPLSCLQNTLLVMMDETPIICSLLWP